MELTSLNTLNNLQKELLSSRWINSQEQVYSLLINPENRRHILDYLSLSEEDGKRLQSELISKLGTDETTSFDNTILPNYPIDPVYKP